ncbi:BcPIE2 [Sclerotinia borealis F-4128]|uniref:BcPIE2 n=1 Tax=Sclerotinia borealis (strain F-4128) TaxID=1432307 RepID=W9C9R0_SCLBF|nr:BcPIE2 [Sclerotinia borealis F-4128]
MGPRRRVTPSGTTSVRAPSGNSGSVSVSVSAAAPSGNASSSVSAPSGISSLVSGLSTITTDKVPEGGDLWALIILFLGVAVLLASGLYTAILAGQNEEELRSFLQNNWQGLDCGVGPLTIAETRMESGLLRKKMLWV